MKKLFTIILLVALAIPVRAQMLHCDSIFSVLTTVSGDSIDFAPPFRYFVSEVIALDSNYNPLPYGTVFSHEPETVARWTRIGKDHSIEGHHAANIYNMIGIYQAKDLCIKNTHVLNMYNLAGFHHEGNVALVIWRMAP